MNRGNEGGKMEDDLLQEIISFGEGPK